MASGGGPERFILAVALVLPLGIAGLSAAQLSGQSLNPTQVLAGNMQDSPSLVHRPAASDPAPPPTLAPPTPTPVPPTATPAPKQPPTPQPTATPRGAATYVVKRGDQLKDIAAAYGVSIRTLINANDVPNPDNLRVGQTLTIPAP
jgi:nucleoid-associated protein YgaU